MWKSVYWNKQPKLTAVIRACEYHERRNRTPAYWSVTYEFRDSEGNKKYGSGKWYGKEEPEIGQEISICYDAKKGKSVIEGTYNTQGAKVLFAVLILWAVFSTICVVNDIDLSRRRH